MRDLIICSTPYQIYTALNMKISGLLSETCDLVVFAYFSDADAIARRVKEGGIFRNVKVSNTRKFLARCLNGKYQRYFWNAVYFTGCKRFTKKYGFLQTYDRIFYSFVDPSIVIMSRYYSGINPCVEYIGFEDGLSDYYNSQSAFKPRWAKWFKIQDGVYKKRTVYLYSPTLAPATNGGYKIIKLPSPLDKPQLVQTLNEMFQFPSGTSIRQQVLYFDQLPHDRVGVSDEFNIQVAGILSSVCADNCIVKIHPRRTDSIYEDAGIDRFPYQSVPFELCCMNMNIEEKIFITNISSACFMPKIIFDKEPTIIFLFDVNHNTHADPAVQDFLNRFTAAYRKPNKLFFVESLDEMKAVLVKLLEG